MKIRMFTDGACSGNPGPGGWGLVINLKEGCKTLSGYELDTTNNRMELVAVLKGLNALLKHDSHLPKISTIEVHSDSAYVVNAITKGWVSKWKTNGWQTTQKTDVKNRDLWEILFKQIAYANKNEIGVLFYKVKGHSGNTFNELADNLAKEGSEEAKRKLARKQVD